MSTATWLRGDVFDVLRTIPDGSVDLVCTSPPFWKQRAYLPLDHPMKDKEIGQEPSPAAFIDVMLALSAEYRRVLSKYGSIAIELADTSAMSGGAGGDYQTGGFRDGQPHWSGSAAAHKVQRVHDPSLGPPIPSRRNLRAGTDRVPGGVSARRGHGARGDDTPEAKSLCMIPESYRIALAYGLNPLTGQPSPADRWIVRNVVDWCRLNPTPGDDGDKFRRASSDIVIATLHPKRWWDGDAVRVPASAKTNARTAKGVDVRPNTTPKADQGGNTNRDTLAIQYMGDGTRPLYDWWEMASDPYPGAHYAVWPPEIARRLILSMCPERVCTTCGEPSRRIVESDSTSQNTRRSVNGNEGDGRTVGAVSSTEVPDYASRRTVGWTDCGHDTWRAGVVLDPFGGSGTTGSVATGCGRDALLIDLDDRNIDLARDRIGMFLEVPD
jgi:DNA methylase